MSFTQDLFTQRRNYQDGNVRIGQLDRIWYDEHRNAFYIGDGVTVGGRLIGTVSGSTANVTFPTPDAPGYLLNDGIGNLSWQVGYSNVNLISYLSTTSLTGNLDLGNLYITDQTIGGKIDNRNITFLPAGSGTVVVPSLAFTGMATAALYPSLATSSLVTYTTLVTQLAKGQPSASVIPSGTYTGINVDVAGPYTVIKLPIAASEMAVGDTVGGAGIVNSSHIRNIGTTDIDGNTVVIIDKWTPVDLVDDQLIVVTRPATQPALHIANDMGVNLLLGSSISSDSIVISNDLVPALDNTYALGHTDLRWKNVWVGPGSIFVTDETLNIDQELTARDGNFEIVGAAGLKVGKFILNDNLLKMTDPALDLIIGTEAATGNVVFNRALKVISPTTSATSFSVSREGYTKIAGTGLPVGQAALSINFSGSAVDYPPTASIAGALIHTVPNTGSIGIWTHDTYINTPSFGTGASVILGRRFRGSIDSPLAVQAGDGILSLNGVGYNGTSLGSGTSGFGAGRLLLKATENFTTSSAAAQWEFHTQEKITGLEFFNLNIDTNGITFPSVANGGKDGAGITFSNSDRLTYFPTPVGNTDYYLKSDGSVMSWQPVSATSVIRQTVLVTSATYTVSDSDWYIGVNRAGTVAITLPSGTTGQELVIKDESGACATYPITLIGTIDNDPGGAILAMDNGAIHMIYRDEWRII